MYNQPIEDKGNKMTDNKVWEFIKDTAQVVIFALILTFILRSFVFETRTIPSGSMLPTLQIGDKLFVDKIYFKMTELKRFDIITFMPPQGAQGGDVKLGTPWIKRLIGLPGDTIQVMDGKLYLNDKPLEEPYIKQKPTYSYGPVTVPDGMVFVMGDNRNNSNDSHFWGFLPMENIKGRAFYRYWPPDRIGPIY